MLQATPAGTNEPPTEQPAAHTTRGIDGLLGAGLIAPGDELALRQVAARFSVAVTTEMLEIIDGRDTADPIARQFVPDTRELDSDSSAISDPIGDQSHSPVAGIVHRYPDRVLLMPLRVCPVYCRFCFRRENVGSNAGETLTNAELEQALDYIRAHDEIWEVILSGGDPLILSPRRLNDILTAIDDIEHVKTLRIHTRVPVVSPTRVTETLVQTLQRKKPVYVVLHSNHPREFTAAARRACAALVNAGLPLLSQTVLLKGVNDDFDTLATLLRTFVENRIKPYYLHHPDRAPGTAHFRVSVAEGQALMRQLRGRLSGLCQPEYVLDIPGGAGKVPLTPQWADRRQAGAYEVRSYTGEAFQYADTPE